MILAATNVKSVLSASLATRSGDRPPKLSLSFFVVVVVLCVVCVRVSVREGQLGAVEVDKKMTISIESKIYLGTKALLGATSTRRRSD